MVTIYKYKIPNHCEGKIRNFLNVKMQYGEPVVWAIVDDTLPEVRAFDFFKVGTGWELVDQDEQIINASIYLGTIKDEEGYIWHCFAAPVQTLEEQAKKQAEEITATEKETEEKEN